MISSSVIPPRVFLCNHIHTAKAGNIVFRFSIIYLPTEQTFRIYILSNILSIGANVCNGRSFDSASAHWLSDGSPYDYVCWSEAISSKEDAEAVADAWAESIAYYILYGGKFGKKRGFSLFGLFR